MIPPDLALLHMTFVLYGRRPVQEQDFLAWSKWAGTEDGRMSVAIDVIDDARVSTAFVGGT